MVKTASGGWKVMRGSSKIAVVKTTGTKKYPVSLYRKDGSSLRTGCCGMNSDGDAYEYPQPDAHPHIDADARNHRLPTRKQP